jgi:hypothetical protein
VAINFDGQVRYANGIPAPGVRVRIFDKDEPGKVDDDLTVTPGTSDSSGRFRVRYDLSRYLDHTPSTVTVPKSPPWDWTLVERTIQVPDLTDLPLPYLEFRYAINGRARRLTAPLVPFQTEFKLPENAPTAFRPSTHGFRFTNNWPGYPLPFSVPAIPGLSSVPTVYGLCGGMSAAACDFLLAGRAIPSRTSAPAQGSPLQQYVYRRQIDTFGMLGAYIARFAEWMAIPDDTLFGTQKRTADEFEGIRAKLDDENAALLGLVYVKAGGGDLWENHQVLAYGYREVSATVIEINIYDPNEPRDDTVRIRAERVPVGTAVTSLMPRRVGTVHGLQCTQLKGTGTTGKTVHGFFDMGYTPVVPPSNLS